MDEELTLPEFDEKKFMQKEFRKAKTAFIACFFGILIGIICHGIWRTVDTPLRWPICFLLAVCSIGFMIKLLQILKIDIKNFTKRDWLGSISFYFLTCLAIFILSINPPFYDASAPHISAVTLPNFQQENGSIMFTAHIMDNTDVSKVIMIVNNSEYTLTSDKNNIYVYNYTGSSTPYEIRSFDRYGNTNSLNGNFSFESDIISVEVPSGIADAQDEIKIKVARNISPNTFRVFYLINDEEEVNVSKTGADGNYDIYTSSPAYLGWHQNEENEFHVFVEVTHYFKGIDAPYVNVIDGGVYTIKTGVDSSIGIETSPQIKGLPKYKPLRTPGFEFAGIAIALLVVVLMQRRKQK